MKKLKLYPDKHQAHFETLAPLSLDKNCENCALHLESPVVCMPADGSEYDPGKPTVMIVGGSVRAVDSTFKRPFSGSTGKFVRDFVSKKFKGTSVVYENAIKCYAGKKDIVKLKVLNTCPSYLHGTYQEVKPERIICIGKGAVQAVLGRSINPNDARKGFSFTSDGTPVFIIPEPTLAVLNRFHRANWEEDMANAMSCKVPNNPLGAECYLVTNEEESEKACEALSQSAWFAFDAETAGVLFNKVFEILCLSASTIDGKTFVWSRESLKDPKVIKPLKELMEDPEVLKVGQNLKYDISALRCGLGIVMQGFHGDTLLWTKMMESDVRASLDILGEKVGMGGHKDEAKKNLEEAKKYVAKCQRELGKSDSLLLPGLTDPIIEEAARTQLESARFAYAYIKSDTLYRYNARDSLSTALVAELLEKRLYDNQHLADVWDKVVKHATPAIEQIEAWGINFDSNKSKDLVKVLDERKVKCKRELVKYGNFNPDSTKDLQTVLYKNLGLKPVKYTDSGAPSTDEQSLKYLKSQHPIADHLLEWRKITKLYGTYAVGLQGHVRDDGRIHPNIKIAGTRTGRLSCVTGDTLINTQNGLVPIIDIAVGDKVLTHRGSYKTVNTVIYQGYQKVVRIKLSNGKSLRCTLNHRLLNSDGKWVTVESILNEHFKEVVERSKEYTRTREENSKFSRESGITCASIITSENRREQSYEGEEGVRAQIGQSGLSDKGRAFSNTPDAKDLYGGVRIEEADFVGIHRTYDISVNDDHSYVACGVFNHNCTQPNLQQVPNVKTPEGRLVKQMFTAKPGHKIVEIDYSQLELRIAAMLSRDVLMREIFESGVDYHLRTAQLISRKAWGIDPEQVTSVHRSYAKTTSFGVLYGMTARTLSQNLNCSVQEAQNIMNALFGSFSKLAEWCDERKKETRKTGVAHTYWDGYIARKRDLWAVANPDDFDTGARITALNSAVNMPVQGTGAEYTLASVIKMVQWLNESNFPAKLVITVHDSLVFEVREDKVDELINKCLDIMLGWPPANGFYVPLKADAEVGDTWGDLVDWVA